MRRAQRKKKETEAHCEVWQTKRKSSGTDTEGKA